MNIDKAVMIFAGCVVLGSIALSHWVHPALIWLTVFAGFNMIQSAFTGFCPVVFVFRKVGLADGCAFQKAKETSK